MLRYRGFLEGEREPERTGRALGPLLKINPDVDKLRIYLKR